MRPPVLNVETPQSSLITWLLGWVHIKGEKTAYTNYYKKMKESEMDQWPPKFWKLQLTTEGKPEVEVAFTDARRFGRIRLVNCPGEDIRKHSPLKENGPDPVVDLDVFTETYLKGKMRARHVPIKAFLLDQTMISGIGNWVADETLYQAKLHPEQYCDEFGDAEVAKLFESIRYVCQLAVDKLGDSDQFPEHWLFNHRWGKGGKGSVAKLPNGEKLAFLTVGGRTSCYAPAVQKKTGRVVPGVKIEQAESPIQDATPRKSRKASEVKLEPEDEDIKVPPKKSKNKTKTNGKQDSKPTKREAEEDDTGTLRRRSKRLRQ